MRSVFPIHAATNAYGLRAAIPRDFIVLAISVSPQILKKYLHNGEMRKTTNTRKRLISKGKVAGTTGLEPATSCVTGRRSKNFDVSAA